MKTSHLENDLELRRILSCCLDCWKAAPVRVEDRVICYSWVAPKYQLQFGGEFRPSRLAALSALGLLAKHDTSRGGNRRYYIIPDPEHVEALLQALPLN